MSNVLAYFPFIGASTSPTEKDMQEFLEMNNMPDGNKLAVGSSPDVKSLIKLRLQVIMPDTLNTECSL